MPPAGSPYAPSTFDGQDDDIKEFLEQFETCAEDARLHDSEMVRYLMRYLTMRQKDIFEAFDGYDENDWTQFLASIKAAFPTAFEPKYTRRSLAQFTSESAKRPIQSKSALAAYFREFNAIARYLLKRETISEDESNRQFWFGLHKSTRKRFRDRLLLIHRDLPHGDPHPYASVFEQGLWVFEWEKGPDWMVDQHVEPTVEDARMLFSNNTDDELNLLLGKLPHLVLNDFEYVVIYNKIRAISQSTAALLKKPITMSNDYTGHLIECKYIPWLTL